jgi:hypothetical protein
VLNTRPANPATMRHYPRRAWSSDAIARRIRVLVTCHDVVRKVPAYTASAAKLHHELLQRVRRLAAHLSLPRGQISRRQRRCPG